MNRKFWITVVVMFVLSFFIGFIVHGVLLAGDYSQLSHLYRPEAEQMKYMAHMTVAHLLIAVAFVWIYLQGRSDKPWLAQGVRYGIAVALLMTVPIYLVYYSLMPLPGMMVAKQIVFDTIGVVIMGVSVAWLNR